MWSFLSLFLLAVVTHVSARNVFVEVKAPWSQYVTSPLVEVAEFLHQQKSSHLYWSFIDTLCQESEKEGSSIWNLFQQEHLSSSSNQTAEAKSDDKSIGLSIESFALSTAKQLLPASTYGFLELFYGLGAFAPTRQFYKTVSEEYSEPCGATASFVVIASIGSSSPSQIVCDEKSLRTALLSLNSQSNHASSNNGEDGVALDDTEAATIEAEVDHFYPSTQSETTSKKPSVKLILYGAMGTPSFCPLHRTLVQLASSSSSEAVDSEFPTIRYSLRYAFPTKQEVEKESNIQGFGIFLDIKNMEYKNVDDSTPSSSAAGGKDGAGDDSKGNKGVTFPAGEEVEGIAFDKLLSRKPTLASELSMLRSELQEKAVDQAQEMKVWKMKDLGLQTVHAIRTAKDPLQKFSDIVQNFPMHAPALSSLKVPTSTREELTLFQNGFGAGLGSNVLYINGHRVDLSGNSFNVYSMLNKLKRDIEQIAELGTLCDSANIRSAILSTASNLGATTSKVVGDDEPLAGLPSELLNIVRVDVSKGAKNVVVFINNLEKDAMYKRWPKKLTQLTFPSWSLHTLSRNLYTVISVVDPMSSEGGRLLSQIAGLFQQQYPLRFGIVLTCPKTSDKVKYARCMEVSQLFLAANSKYSPLSAGVFLFSLSELLTTAPEQLIEMSQTELISAYASSLTYQDSSIDQSELSAYATKVLQDGLFKEYLDNSAAFLRARGLPANSYSLNGIVKPDGELQSIMQLLGREQYILSHLVRRGYLKEKTTSIFNAILDVSEAYVRYHTMLESSHVEYEDLLTEKMKHFLPKLSSHFLVHPSEKASTTFLNTTIVIFPVSEIGLKSVAGAVTWLTTVAPAGKHRLALLPILEPGVVSCLSSIVSVDTVSRTFAIDPSTPKDICSLKTTAADALLSTFTGISNDKSTSSSTPITFDDLERVVAVAKILQLLKESSSQGNAAPDIYVHAAQILSDISDDTLTVPQALEKGVCIASGSGDVSESDDESGSESGNGSGSVCLSSTGSVVLASLNSHLSSSTHFLESLKSVGETQALLTQSLNLDGFSYDEVTVFYNSRKLTVDPDTGYPLHELDFNLLANLEWMRLGSKFDSKLTDDSVTMTSDLYTQMCSFIGTYGTEGSKRTDAEGLISQISTAAGSEFDSLILRVDPTIANPAYTDVSAVFVLDPLTLAGQRASGLMKLFRDALGIKQTIFITPQLSLNEFPLQNFYRPLLSPRQVGSQSLPAAAVFLSLPRQHTLTLRIDAPEPWNIQAHAAVQDIDNLRCSDDKNCGDPNPSGAPSDTTQVTYMLKSILLAGQCFEFNYSPYNRKPPNGLQLTLSKAYRHPLQVSNANYTTEMSQTHSDTLVMQNFGYFQLQANPGLWRLGLAPGRASNLFTIDGSVTTSTHSGAKIFFVKGFDETISQLGVTKRPGKEQVSLLSLSTDGTKLDDDEDDAVNDSVWNRMSSMFGGGADKYKKVNQKGALTKNEEDDKIHVFSLATGHMYERLLRIMMLSVSKRTSMPVKFWLFENYLSPTFKQMADVMAKEYGFEVGYVTYKWPEWLTQQTQKQRIIWGYKILFLDVLFPLNVKKVIYVDSDQVLRADLKELWGIDLQGKPYAYTPFCTSRKETLGFQFWRDGYWKDHLQGKPYHISALYVVDLQQFRRHAVGDQLRAIYDGLARDPNSLANLDQDLPNYAQHNVPIHSLPQEWLWCETWCSDESKSTAKMIDLCNNPLHKEPKLDMARRVVSGGLFNESWVQLDAEIKELQKRHGLISSE